MTEEPEPFSPLERNQGKTVEGYDEALYDLSDDRGQFGQVKLWSRGAYTIGTQKETVTAIHIGFELENSGDRALWLEPAGVRLESVQTRTRTLRDIPATFPGGQLTVAPGATGKVEAQFALPAGTWPDDVRAFRVAWTVRTNGDRYSEFTPFAQSAPRRVYVPVRAYYDPYYPYTYPLYDPFYSPHWRVVIVKPYPRRVIVHGRRRHRR
jgi:hypothetical protein